MKTEQEIRQELAEHVQHFNTMECAEDEFLAQRELLYITALKWCLGELDGLGFAAGLPANLEINPLELDIL